MHPHLIGRRRLRTTGRLRVHQEVFIAAAVMFGVIGATILLQDPFQSTPVQAAPVPRHIVVVPLLPGTEIPLPPESLLVGANPKKAAKGEFTFLPAAAVAQSAEATKGAQPTKGAKNAKLAKNPFTTDMSGRVYDFYGATMVTNGWTFVSKSPPSPAGEWTISARLGARQATIAMYMIPSAQLVIDACPPFPYC
jgi:hypothetical protein